MSVARNFYYNMLGSIIPTLLALVTVPIYLKVIGTERYGILAISWLLLGYFGLFDLGLGRATTYRIASLGGDARQEHADIFWSSVVVNALLGLVGALILWVVAHYSLTSLFKITPALRPEIAGSIPYLALSVPVATLTGVLTGALQGRGRFLEINAVSVLSTALFQILPLATAVLIGPSLGLILAAALGARVLAIVVLWVQCRRHILRGFRGSVRRHEIKHLLGYGGWVSVDALFAPMLVMADRFIIGAMLGPTAITVYTIPFQMVQRMQIIPIALTQALFPRLPTAEPAAQQRMTETALGTLMAAISVPVFFGMTFFHLFLTIWLGHDMAMKSTAIGIAILAGMWINAPGYVLFGVLQARGRPDLIMKAHLAEFVPYFALLYVLMTHLGIVGAAIAFAIRCAVDYVILSVMVSRRVTHLVATLSFIALLTAAVALGLWHDYLNPIFWALAALAGAGLFAAVWFSTPGSVKNQLIGQLRSLVERARGLNRTEKMPEPE